VSSSNTATANVTVALAPPLTVAVSGQLVVPDTTRVDGDTNDTRLTPVSNNTFQTAQAMPNPVIVGGYVNQPGAGDEGPVKTAGDTGDFFRVELLRGQVIELTVANPSPATNDVDLQLYSNAQVLVDASIGTGATERLTVAASGTYFLRATAFGGASNYVLTVGQTGSMAQASDLVLSREFVPGELLVKSRPAGSRADTASAHVTTASIARTHGLELRPSAPDMHSLMKLDRVSAQTLDIQRKQVAGDDRPIRFVNEESRLKYTTLETIKALATRPDVEWVEPNWILHPFAVPNDPGFPRQRWHYEMIQLPQAWDTTTGSPNVVAAVLDTGVRRHSDLVDRLDPGFDFVSNSGAADGNGDDNDPSDPGSPSQGALEFHGTHVAGTIGATGNNAQGATGVAWNTRILPVRVLGLDGGSGEDIAQGILFAAGLQNRAGVLPVRKADVINLSLGGPGQCPQAFRDLFARVRAAGVIVIAAAGNDNVNGDYFPAGCPGVVTVSSVGPARTRAPYSNFGTGVDVAAPGGDMSRDLNGDGNPDGIYSTYSAMNGAAYVSTFADLQGTSMAAPHVAGVVALMKSVNPSLTPAMFDNLLTSGALTDDIGPPGADVLGIGLINAAKAVTAASGNPPSTPARLTVTPTSLNFGSTATANDVVVASAGNGTLTVASTMTSAPWITVANQQATPGALGTWRIQVNRTGLAAGTYNGWVDFRGSVGATVRVSLLMQVTTTASMPDAGQHYILLIDPDSGDTEYQVEVVARGETVNFRFPSVSLGTYELTAGTDLNNDGFICDNGEACAEYPELGESQPIEITGERSGLVLTTGFRTYTNTSGSSSALDSPSLTIRRGVRRLR
jgi:serine protease